MKKKFLLTLIVFYVCILLSGCENFPGEGSNDPTSHESYSLSNSIEPSSAEIFSGPGDDMQAIQSAADAISPSEDDLSNMEERYAIENDAGLKGVAALVNDVPIYDWMVELAVQSDQVTFENTKKQLENAEMSEKDKQQLLETYKPKDRKTLLNQLIRSEVTNQLAAKEVGPVSDEEALDEAEKVLLQVKQMLTSDNESERQQAEQVYSGIKAAYEIYQITEDEYLREYMAPSYKTALTNQKLYEKFTQGLTEEEKPNAQNLYQDFIDQAVQDAHIIIY